jgi:magnesium transporter
MSSPGALEQHLVECFFTEHPAQAAATLEARSVKDVAALLASVPGPRVAPVLERLNAQVGAAALARLDPDAGASLVAALDPVRAAGLLANMDEAARAQLAARLPAALANDLQRVLEFPIGTAGWLMDARVTTFPETTSVRQTLEVIRTLSGVRITDIVIASASHDFVGVVALQDLVGASPERPLAELVRRDAPHVAPMATRDDVVGLMDAYSLASIPVVGLDGKVLGIIQHHALVDAAQQMLGGDMQQMVGAGAEERALSSAWFSVKSRLPWLQINLLTAFLASAVVGVFDETIAKFTALAVLMPVVAGQSGNTGAQALAVTARGLALREIRTSHVWRVLSKELVVSLVNGVAVALVTCIGVLLWSQSPALALVIGVSMIVSMVLAALAGGAIPIILTALDRDPATASSIILTTVTDVCGFFSFLGLATLLSGWLGAS